MKNDQRGSWYLLTGVLLGLGLGLVYAWVVSPARYTNVTPETLSDPYRDGYRVAIASAYAATGDLGRAKARLDLLQDENPVEVLAAQSQRYLAEGYPYIQAEALAILAADLGQTNNPATTTGTQAQPEPATATASPTREATITPSKAVSVSATEASASESETPSVTETPAMSPTNTSSPSPTASQTSIATLTPLPTKTLTLTPHPPFVLEQRERICDPDLGESQLQIYVIDENGDGIPGVEIVIQGEDDMEEHFFTGLKPDMGWGYADYLMEPNLKYFLQVGKGGKMVPASSPECPADQEESYWGSWRLTFSTP